MVVLDGEKLGTPAACGDGHPSDKVLHPSFHASPKQRSRKQKSETFQMRISSTSLCFSSPSSAATHSESVSAGSSSPLPPARSLSSLRSGRFELCALHQ